jgi:hypothetical protein
VGHRRQFERLMGYRIAASRRPAGSHRTDRRSLVGTHAPDHGLTVQGPPSAVA